MASFASTQPTQSTHTTINQVERVEDVDVTILDALDLSVSFSALSNVSMSSEVANMSLDMDPAQLPSSSNLGLGLFDSDVMAGVESTTESTASSGRTTPTTEDGDTYMPPPTFEEFELEIVHLLREPRSLDLESDVMMVDE